MTLIGVGSATSSGQRVGHHVSLEQVESAALKRMAADEDRGVISWFIQRLIDERMRSKVGSNWRSQLASELGLKDEEPSS